MTLTLFAAALLGKLPSVDAAQLKAWGTETLANIDRRYKNSESGLYAENYSLASQTADKFEPSFDWDVGVLLSAFNAGARQDDKLKPELRSYVEATRSYWNDSPPVPGYDVLPHARGFDRFYDDNEWMVMTLADASKVLKGPKYLEWAEQTLAYVLSGEDDKLGGGIYWHENEKRSKNTCSNAPAAAALLDVYRMTRKRDYLLKAEQLYAWTLAKLEDPSDGLMWDNISLDGNIQKTKWSYNTALMLRTAAELYSLTRRTPYRQEAIRLFRASRNKWFDPSTGALHDEAPFAHLLFEAWIIAAKDVPELDLDFSDVSAPLVYVHDHALSGDLYGDRWDAAPSGDQKNFKLINQAAAARAYFEGAEYLEQKRSSR